MIRFTCSLLSGLLLLTLLPVQAVGSSSNVRQQQEIDHLLQFIEYSDCTFIRNNESYSGLRAREHIEKKFNYVKKRKEQISAEEFIQYAASRSSLSKKEYMVNCGPKTMTSEGWLVEELARYRQFLKDGSSSQGVQ